MKKIRKPLLLALLLIALFSGVLVVALRSFAFAPTDSALELNDVLDESVFADDKPLDQEFMQKKFDAFNVISEDGTTVWVSQNLPEGTSRRSALRYEEILFLVNDSIRLYDTYDVIELPNKTVRPLRIDPQSTSKKAATWAYSEILADISDLIRARIALYDSGFEEHTVPRGETTISAMGMFVGSCPEVESEDYDGQVQTMLSALSALGVLESTSFPRCTLREAHNFVYAITEERYEAKNVCLFVLRAGKSVASKIFPTDELSNRLGEMLRTSTSSQDNLFSLLTDRLCPDFDQTQTAPEFTEEEFRDRIEVGMTYETLIQTFGIPQNGGSFVPPDSAYNYYFPRFCYLIGKYRTTDGNTVYCYLDEQYRVADLEYQLLYRDPFVKGIDSNDYGKRFMEYTGGNTLLRIDSYEELVAFRDFGIEKKDGKYVFGHDPFDLENREDEWKEYFNRYSLFVTFDYEGSISVEIEVIDVTIKNGVLTLSVLRIVPEGRLEAIATWLIGVSVPKQELECVTSHTARFTEINLSEIIED